MADIQYLRPTTESMIAASDDMPARDLTMHVKGLLEAHLGGLDFIETFVPAVERDTGGVYATRGVFMKEGVEFCAVKELNRCHLPAGFRSRITNYTTITETEHAPKGVLFDVYKETEI